MIKEQPLVSVITVTYNSARYVRDAIESVLSQDYPNIEYIIGDDYSSDNTWDIIQEYANSHIRSYRNERNIGEYPNRNKAINLAQGKYLLFIDGDDVIYPHGISYFVDMIEPYPDVAFAVQKGYTNNIIFPIVLQPSILLKNYFFGRNSLLSSSFASDFFRTDLLKKCGGLSEKYRTGDDEIRLRLASQYPVLLIAGWVTWPRETPNQASSTLSDGTGLSEHVQISKELINKGLIKDSILSDHLIKFNKKKVSGFVLRKVVKGEFGKARNVLNKTGYRFLDVIKYVFYEHQVVDFLDEYTSAKPLKSQNRSVSNLHKPHKV